MNLARNEDHNTIYFYNFYGVDNTETFLPTSLRIWCNL